MSEYWIWWIAAAMLVGAELLTGTYYLLAVGLALAIGGTAAWLGAGAPVQFAIAAVAGVLATVAAHQWRMRRALPPPQTASDVGRSSRCTSTSGTRTAPLASPTGAPSGRRSSPRPTRRAPGRCTSWRCADRFVVADRRALRGTTGGRRRHVRDRLAAVHARAVRVSR